MKIIKEGKAVPERPLVVECGHCEAVFECVEEDLSPVAGDIFSTSRVTCPCCNKPLNIQHTIRGPKEGKVLRR